MAAAAAASLFEALDKDGDGKEEAAAADADGDGLLDRGEFLRLAREAAEAADDDAEGRRRCLRAAFGMYVDDASEAAGRGGQYITPASLQRTLSRLLGSQQQQQQQLALDECRAMICRFDLDGDGVLSFE
ncbi:putative calcium-binding protein CML25/26 [Panicum miliaceum]|uniref:Calcium-binding protein CML25/26 n=1 Tax=Panicum miliaceum TaxID=4540 RepID=A0A3L6SV14_PANMI|nr:putative calcium-binding protein CML25/26 [Panicum miliaceum]